MSPAVLRWPILERRPRLDGFFVSVFVYGDVLSQLTTDFVHADPRSLGLPSARQPVDDRDGPLDAGP